MAFKKTCYPWNLFRTFRVAGAGRGDPCFPPLSRFRRPFPATLGGKPPSRDTKGCTKHRQNDHWWTKMWRLWMIQYNSIWSYTHSFHMFPQQLWCAMIYWELLMVCLLRFLPPNSQYGDDRISAGFGVPHRLHLENAQRENSEGWSSRTRKKNGND